MIRGHQLKAILKECQSKKVGFTQTFRESLGIESIRNMNGEFANKWNKNKAQMGAEEFSLRTLAEDLIGQEYVANLHNPDRMPDSEMALLQEDISPVLPSAAANISLFNATAAGLAELKILEGYGTPGLIGDELVETQSVRANGGKMVGAARPLPPRRYTQPGEPLPQVGLRERWIECPANNKLGQSISLTKETIFYDYSGTFLQNALDLGKGLAEAREAAIACLVMGINLTQDASQYLPAGATGNTFVYDGSFGATPNNTYQVSAGTGPYNYTNELASNTFVDYVNIQTAQAQLNLMTDYETSRRINARIVQLLFSPQKIYAIKAALHTTQIIPVSNGGTTSFPTLMAMSDNPLRDDMPSLHYSPIFNQVAVESGLSQTTADATWFSGNFKQAFVWRQAWPLLVESANPTSESMMSKQVVNAWFASWYGVGAVREPRYVQKNGS